MPAETVLQKAHRYLIEGRVKVRRHDAHGAMVHVRGSKDEVYHVTYGAGIWSCDCPARVSGCAHVVAAQYISPLETKAEEAHFATDTDLDAFLG